MHRSEILFYRTTKDHLPTEEELRSVRVTDDTAIAQVEPGKAIEVSTSTSGKVKIGCSRDNQATIVIFEKEKKVLVDSSALSVRNDDSWDTI